MRVGKEHDRYGKKIDTDPHLEQELVGERTAAQGNAAPSVWEVLRRAKRLRSRPGGHEQFLCSQAPEGDVLLSELRERRS